MTGSYDYQGVASTIDGTIAGRTLTGTYRQPTYTDPRWRSGNFSLTLADCDNWSGTFTDNAGAGLYGWSATRILEDAPAPTAMQSGGTGAASGLTAEAPTQPGGGGQAEGLSEMRPPAHLTLRGLIGVQQASADLRRTGEGDWEWLESGTRFQFRALSETGSELLIFDRSRDIYHHLILTTGQSFWRVGTTGPWSPHYTIASIERAGAQQ